MSILSADVSLTTVGVVDTGSPNTFTFNPKLNQLSVTISLPDAEAPNFETADKINLEILGQTTSCFILKDASYTFSVYVVDNLVADVTLGLNFLPFNGVKIDVINCSIKNTRHTGSCRKPMALPKVPVLISLGLSQIFILVTCSFLITQYSTDSRAVFNITTTFQRYREFRYFTYGDDF